MYVLDTTASLCCSIESIACVCHMDIAATIEIEMNRRPDQTSRTNWRCAFGSVVTASISLAPPVPSSGLSPASHPRIQRPDPSAHGVIRRNEMAQQRSAGTNFSQIHYA